MFHFQSLSKEIKDESSVSSEGLVGRGEVKDEINSAEQTEKVHKYTLLLNDQSMVPALN